MTCYWLTHHLNTITGLFDRNEWFKLLPFLWKIQITDFQHFINFFFGADCL